MKTIYLLVQIGFDSVKYIQNQSDYYSFHFCWNSPVTIIKHILAYFLSLNLGSHLDFGNECYIESNKALLPYLEKGESKVF